jgi:hypothetical protein
MSPCVKDKFSKSVWKKEEEKFKKLEEKIKIPDKCLNKVDFVILKTKDDFNSIPNTGGCYWVWTNEPVKHRFHRNKIPERIYKGEIIYNGIAKDNVQDRIIHHLYGKEDAGWSGISLDIYYKKSISHRKKLMSAKGKVPYVECSTNSRKGKKDGELKPIRNKELLFKLFLSNKEKSFLKKSNKKIYYFRNGVDIFEPKHQRYKFRVYFVTGLETLYTEYIEKRWREKFGLPKLCSYSSGR